MKKLARLFTLGIVTSLLASGCATLEKGTRHNVTVESAPRGATVIVNGQVAGVTPIMLGLSRQRSHEVTIERPGYVSEHVTILSVPNEAAQAYVRFDLDRQSGAHRDLVPSAIRVDLDPLLLPERVGRDPISELAMKVLDVDELLYRGEIDANEHRYLINRLLRFYEQH
jgi:hypothetical protein